MLSPCSYVDLARNADDTAVITTFPQLALLLRYLEPYLSDLQRCLSKWSVAINFSKSSVMLLPMIDGSIPKPRAVQLFADPIQWIDDARYFGVTVDKGLT
jgi:hypothetical protein